MDWNEGMKEGKHPWRKVSYPMGLASDHQRKDWTQVGKAGSQPISPIKQASESTGFVSFSSGIGPEKERAAKLERLAQRSYYFTKAQSNQAYAVTKSASTNIAISPFFCAGISLWFHLLLSFLLEPFNSLDTDPISMLLFLTHLLSSLSDLYLVQSEMILSLMYLQFHIDGYIPHISASPPLIFPAWRNGRYFLFFFSSYLLPFRMKPEDSLWSGLLPYLILRPDPLYNELYKESWISIISRGSLPRASFQKKTPISKRAYS